MTRYFVALAMMSVWGAGCSNEHLVNATGELAFREDSIDFGRIVSGSSGVRHAELVNPGRAALKVDGSSSTPDLRFSPAHVTLQPGEQILVSLEWAGDLAGQVEAQVRFATASGEREASIVVRADFIEAFSGLPAVVDFGGVRLGARETLVLPFRSIVDEWLSVSARVIGDPDFEVLQERVAIGPREEAEIELGFSPGERGPRKGTLILEPCEGCQASRVALEGAGQIASVSAEPDVVDFGEVRFGTDDVHGTLRIWNDGDLSLNLTAIMAGPPFTLDASGLDGPLAPGDSVDLALSASVTEAGAFDGHLKLEDATGTLLVSVPLAIKVIPWISSWPAELDFGAQPPGRAVTKRVWLQSVGPPAGVRLLWTKVQGDGAAAFLIPASSSSLTIGGAPLGVEVTFQMGMVGARAAELVLELSDSKQPRISVPLRAETLESHCELDVLPADFRMPAGVTWPMTLGLLRSHVVHHRKFWLVNQGPSDCLVWDLSAFAGSGIVAKASPPYLIPTGDVLPIETDAWVEDIAAPPWPESIACKPDGKCYNADMTKINVFHSTQGSTPFELFLAAGAYANFLTHTPEVVEFDDTVPGARAVQRVRLSGPDDRANSWGPFSFLRVSPNSSTAFSIEPFTPPPEGSQLDRFSFDVSFEPQSAGFHSGWVEVQTNFVDRPLRIQLFGRSRDLPSGRP